MGRKQLFLPLPRAPNHNGSAITSTLMNKLMLIKRK